MEAKPFNIADVLSITTGRLVSWQGIGGVYTILNHMTGDSLMTHQLGRAAEACKPALLADHPWLEAMGVDLVAALDGLPKGADAVPVIREKLVEFTVRLGCSDINVLPLNAGQWLAIDPLKELAAMVGEERIIPVVLD